jgi:FkbM family methyltransferase
MFFWKPRLFSTIKKFRLVTKKFGWNTALKMVLYRLNIVKQRVHYPYSSLTVSVERGQPIFWKGLEDGEITNNQIKYIIDLVKKGDTIIDVGAWIGDLSLLFSHLVGEKGVVHAFEPMNESFSILEKNTRLNNMDNIQLHNMAISNVLDDVTLYSSSSTGQQASMRKKIEDNELRNKEKIFTSKSTTIDHFCKSNNIRPDGIKIDVQGEEGNVLKEAADTIEKDHPWFLLDYHYDFLSELEREEIWTYIHDNAKKIIHIDGCEDTLTYGDQYPDGFIPMKNSRLCIYF